MIDLASLPSLPLTDVALLPDSPGVYFAISKEGEVLYVGRADSLLNRWRGHERKSQLMAIEGIRLAWLHSTEELVALEREHIEAFNPPLNWSEQIPRRGKYQTVAVQVRCPLSLVMWLRSEAAKSSLPRSVPSQIREIIAEAKRQQEQAA